MIISLFALLSINSFSQRKYSISRSSFGGYLSFNLPKYTTDFNKLSGIPNCCPRFTSGDGTGSEIGALLQFRLFAYNYIRFKAGLNILSARLTSDETMWIVLNEELYAGKIRHEIESNFLFLNFEPSYKFSTPVGLSFLAGINFAMNINSAFRQKEYIIEPENEGTFENGLRARNQYEGDLEGTNPITILPFISTEYDIALNKNETIIISPSFSFYYGLNSILSHENWKYFYFSFGLNLRFSTLTESSSPIMPGN